MEKPKPTLRRTKIVATIGPASNSPEMLRALIAAGMNVARLNLSHGTHEDHARVVGLLRSIAQELDSPVTLLLDLQGPKVRVGALPGGEITLTTGQTISLVPESEFHGEPLTIPIDYPHAAEDAKAGMQVLLADGLFELQVTEIVGQALRCHVVEGGVLKSRKGVNFPNLDLRLPSMTEKDLRDLDFGLEQKVDWVSLSFVRRGADVQELKDRIAAKGAHTPVIAKMEKPQAIERLDEILDVVDGVMVARGDLGVELSPERVPMLQKRIIEQCNRRGLPVITATQMLESMIQEPRPTRAEASDVANAIIDGTDAVMLSGETAVGAYPVKAVEMMARIAREVESRIEFRSYPVANGSRPQALSAAAETVAKTIDPRCIVVLTTSGHTAQAVASRRTKPPVAAYTTNPAVYHSLNLIWGVRPFLVATAPETFEGLIEQAESTLRDRGLIGSGDTILVMGGIPSGTPHGGNFLKIHTLA